MSQKKKRTVLICIHVRGGGPECLSCGGQDSKALMRELMDLLEKKNLTDIDVSESRCMGLCENGCMMYIEPDGVRYQRVTPADLDEIVTSHFIQGRVVNRLKFT